MRGGWAGKVVWIELIRCLWYGGWAEALYSQGFNESGVGWEDLLASQQLAQQIRFRPQGLKPTSALNKELKIFTHRPELPSA